MRSASFLIVTLILLCAGMRAGDADVLVRLRELAQLCNELSAAGVKSQFSGELKHPRQSDLKRLQRACSWFADEVRVDLREVEIPPRWPLDADAPRLRELLKHEEAAIRALAFRALASLHIPEDLPRLAELLKDESIGGPWPGTSRLSIPFLGGERDIPDPPLLEFTWNFDSMELMARVILFELTGESFHVTQFDEWWARNSKPQECLWYWEAQMRRDKAACVDAAMAEAIREKKDRVMESVLDAWREKWRKRLRELPPELELKILLTGAEIAGGEPEIVREDSKRMFSAADFQRVPAERLLKLLDGINAWTDLKWEGEYVNRLTDRLLLTPGVFKPEHAPKLKTIFEKQSQSLWWSGKAAFPIGISRLLPPCGENRDDLATREGWLRQNIRTHDDVFTRGCVLRELIDVGLPQDAEFIREYFFQPQDRSSVPNVRVSILRGLGARPLNKEKRAFLLELLLDPRVESEWVRSLKAMGDDSFQMYAAQSINAHAGKELITWQELQSLRDAENAKRAFPGIQEKLRAMKGK